MIAKHSVEKLKDQIDIVDIVSQSLNLIKAGANFKACCPFHGEDTPSLTISPVKQIYHCFGCGAGGDAIKFVQEYYKLSYPEALENIANHLNFSLEYDNIKEKKDYKNIIESVNDYYVKNLKDQELNYLLTRGITKESIEKFEIGFADQSKDTIEFLKQNFLNLQDATDIGIISQGASGLYSRLISRITFPIRNHANKLIGFGGRTTVNHSAKYVNSIQTPLFDKSRSLYGLNLAKEYIYKKGICVITEGYLDVVMMRQAGIKTAVATMGTALTEQHIPILKKMNCKVILCYDGDKAGKNAAYKASILLSKHEINGTVVIFNDGVDPADMVKDGKEKELVILMKNGIPLIKYVLDTIISNHDIKDPYGKNEAVKQALDILNNLNPIISNEYLNYISEKLKINKEHIALTPIAPKLTPQANTPSLKNTELNLIASALEDFSALNKIMEHKDIFTTCKQEVEEFISQKKDFSYLTLKDDIIIYKEKEFKTQLALLAVDKTQEKISKLQFQDLDIKEKISATKQLQKKIFEYKQGRI